MRRAAALYLPARTVWLDTASGSRYRVDPAAGTWARLSHDPRSDALRTTGGALLGLARAPRLGEPALLVCPPIVAGSAVRLVGTTPVVRVWHDEPRAPHRAVPGWWD
jgi:hypothetical protein